MEQAALQGGALITKPHQRALAIAVMHGARRRLGSALARYCPDLPVTVSTIHSVALTIVNRWRRSLGLSMPVTVCEHTCHLSERHGRTQATFEEVMELGCKVLASPTARQMLSASYPLIIVDEFQDCTGNTLGFVQALAEASTVLFAADHFQKLQDVNSGCPAVEWAQALRADGGISYEELAGCRRTDSTAILLAARALRDDLPSATLTVPVYYAPNVGPAAFRMVGRFRSWVPDRIKTGTCALILLSLEDALLPKLLASFAKQLAKRNPKRQVKWSRSVSQAEQQRQLFLELGLNGADEIWRPEAAGLSHLAGSVARDVKRYCRLRGITDVPSDLAGQFATLAVHNRRAFGWGSPQFEVLTVHGAKNREFEHVFVFWTCFKAAKWSIEEQRRLLYNAVTRAKADCTVIALGDAKVAQDDPVLSLLGPAQPAIDPAWKKKSTAKT